MSERKECPLRVLAGKTAEFALCRGEDCAWYDEVGKVCAIYYLWYLIKIVSAIREVKDIE